MSETCTLRDILDGKVAKENVIAIWQPIARIEPFNEAKDHYKVYYWDDYLQGDERIIVDIDHEFLLMPTDELAALRTQVAELERQLALTERDFKPLKQDYERLYELVERVRHYRSARDGYFADELAEALLELGKDADKLLSELAEVTTVSENEH